MDTDSKDKMREVIHKLSAVNDLFAFYWFAHEHADFQRDSIMGLSDIVSQCIGELKEVARDEHRHTVDKAADTVNTEHTKQTAAPHRHKSGFFVSLS